MVLKGRGTPGRNEARYIGRHNVGEELGRYEF